MKRLEGFGHIDVKVPNLKMINVTGYFAFVVALERYQLSIFTLLNKQVMHGKVSGVGPNWMERTQVLQFPLQILSLVHNESQRYD